MLDAQERIGIPESARAPIDRSWARRIAQTLLVFPLAEDADSDPSTPAKRTNVLAKLAEVYDGLQTIFGDYTDEVLLYAVSEYKGLDKSVTKTLTGAMKQIVLGRDPFANARKLADTAASVTDITQAEQAAGVQPQKLPSGNVVSGGYFNPNDVPVVPATGEDDVQEGAVSDLPGDIDGDGQLSPEEQQRLAENQGPSE
jgi:hypothetical protein